ncbi:MAG: A/G-specific adenine glycosylase, partial [Candidatus Competibacterales bacterium]|nr:A/G-specific adenine glycosylase [Candidatus Competibacterales bacterium]
MTVAPDSFAGRVLAWFDRHGRRSLPWQQQPTPYRVWISEIMLQQTQVATVIPYYQRFMARFPVPAALAVAPLDEVLAHWSGLGYYARARNLHRAAREIRENHGGELPETLDALAALPGIGRSTAGAVLALSRGQRHPILDGNVKRVLARYHAVPGWPGRTAVQRELWALAEHHTPAGRVADYTQAMMDLGALVCTRRRPRCRTCPLAADCAAHTGGREHEFPAPRPRKALPVRRTRMLLLRTPQAEILLERRPPNGIWGGLWSLPECPPEAKIADWCAQHHDLTVLDQQPWAELQHAFTHFRLVI